MWDYPRPPRLEPTVRRIRVIHASVVVVDSHRAMRVLETSHPPVYYVPPEDVRMDLLRPGIGRSYCEWKGAAAYHDLVIDGRVVEAAAWSYATPTPAFAALRAHLAFYAGRVDACWVDDEPATPQPGRFYGGWITADLVGPFKGGPGSAGW